MPIVHPPFDVLSSWGGDISTVEIIMSSDPDAYLVYGYDLGNSFVYVKEYSDYQLKLGWLDDLSLDEEVIEERLRQFLGTDHGLEIVTYGGFEDPSYVLIASNSHYRTDWNTSLVLSDLGERMRPQVVAAYQALLQRGIEVLGITPIQKEPNWLLIADYPE